MQTNHLNTSVLLKSEAKWQYTYLSIFDVKSNIREKNGKKAPVCQIFILQQVNVEKNGFDSFIEQ